MAMLDSESISRGIPTSPRLSLGDISDRFSKLNAAQKYQFRKKLQSLLDTLSTELSLAEDIDVDAPSIRKSDQCIITLNGLAERASLDPNILMTRSHFQLVLDVATENSRNNIKTTIGN